MVRRGQITIDDSLNLQGGLAVSSSPAPVSADALIIKNAACQLLERVGIAISHQATRQAVIANGAQPLPSGRVAITTAMVDEALQTAPHRLHRVARQPHLSFDQDHQHIFFAASGAASHVVVADETAPTKKIRPATSGDVRQLITLANQLPLYNQLGFFVKPDALLQELGGVQPTYNWLIDALYDLSDKPFSIALYNHDILPQLLHDRPDLAQRASLNIQPILASLAWDSDLGESFYHAVMAGMTIDCSATTLAAATAPATLAGSLTLSLAMNLASLSIAQSLRAGAAIAIGFNLFTTDLKQGTLTAGSAESALLQEKAVELAQLCRLPCSITSGQTSAKVPDQQAGIEKSLGLLALVRRGVGLGQGFMVGQAGGLLSDTQVISAASLVLDHDLIAMVKRMSLNTPAVTLADTHLDVAERVLNRGGHFLAEPETRRIMKSQYYYPDSHDRLSLLSWQEAGGWTAETLAYQVIKKLVANQQK